MHNVDTNALCGHYGHYVSFFRDRTTQDNMDNNRGILSIFVTQDNNLGILPIVITQDNTENNSDILYQLPLPRTIIRVFYRSSYHRTLRKII